MDSSSTASGGSSRDARAGGLNQPSPAARLDHETIWGAVALLMFAAAWLPPPIDPRSPLSFCPFRFLTGLPCFLCGGTRAMQAFVRGRWGAAWALNPLATVLGAGAGLYLLYALYAVGADRRWRPRVARPRRLVALCLLGAVLAAVANWCYLIHVGR